MCNKRLTVVVLATVFLGVAGLRRAEASFHTWDINEIYSNADGTIQFIEMKETAGFNSQHLLSGHSFTTTANTFNFSNLPNNQTANKFFLMATSGFAVLVGAPVPDYVIPDGFFSVTGDTLNFAGGFDIVTFGPGDLPGCVKFSMNDNLTVGLNSPRNFAGSSTTLFSTLPAGDLDDDCGVDMSDVILLAGEWLLGGPPGDLNGDGSVNLLDLALLAGNWLLDCELTPAASGCLP